MGNIKGGGSITVGYRYYMSLQMGLCRGPIDEIVQINVGDVRAWPLPDGDSQTDSGMMLVATGPNGNGIAQYEDGSSSFISPASINTVTGTTITSINAPTLFGGDKKEGGVQGTLWVYMGAKTQVYASTLKNWLGGLVPDFRGVVTLFFDGLLTSLNPYPKAWKVRVRRVLSGWDGDVWQPALASIWLRNGMIKAMNPAHIIYECLTNRDWGRGFSRNLIDNAGFLAVAQKLYNENLGLCMRWNRQDELGDFIQEVIDHIGGSLYLDRTTGLLTISLLRGDYDVNTLPTFTYDSGLISIEDDETNSRSDLVNETIINWHDPIRNDDRQVRLHNLASMQATGAIKSTTTSYSGAPTVDLASVLGQRDLKASATSLKRYKIILDRRAWKLIPGSVFKISAPDKNIFSVVVRAGKVSEASAPDGQITVEAVIDVFGLPSASFVSGQNSNWEQPDRTPVIIVRRAVREATYGELVRRLSAADLANLGTTSGTIAVVGVKPTNMSQGYSVNTRTGSDNFTKRNSGSFAPAADLAAPIGPYDTTVSFNNGFEMGLVELDSLVQIGNEICRLDDILTTDGITGTVVLGRGCADTLPSSHSASSTIFFAGDRFESDNVEYSIGELVDVRLTTVTSTQELPVAVAPTDSILIQARQARPWPPANLQVNGNGFASVPALTGDLVLTWAHRDRTIIQDQLVEHTGGSIGPEAGTTYNLRVYKLLTDLSPVRTITSINDATWTYTDAMRVADGVGDNVVFELESIRGSLTSQFKYRFNVEYLPTPAALSSFTAVVSAGVSLSAVAPSGGNTASVQFYRTYAGNSLNVNANKLGSPKAVDSSRTATVMDSPGAGSWDYYAQPISSAGVGGPIRGPVGVSI